MATLRPQVKSPNGALLSWTAYGISPPSGELADELGVTPQRILNEVGRRGVRLTAVNDRIPRNIVTWIRDYFEILKPSG